MKIENKKLVGDVSWGDNIDPDLPVAKEWILDRPETIERTMNRLIEEGFDKIYWRVDTMMLHRYFKSQHQPNRAKLFHRIEEILNRMDPLGCAVESAHRTGLEIYPRIDIFDDGCPPEVLTYSWRSTEPHPFLYQSTFSIEHPEYIAVDRGGRNRHWGVLELAYPEVRTHKLDIIKSFTERYDADGVFLYVPSHSTPPAYFGDQYGFSQPVVEAFERRYGINILKQDFDLENWRRLRGSFLTLFFREVKDYLSRSGKKLGLALAQGDYIGPPFGNLHMDWRTWIKEGIVDELCVGVVVDNYQHFSPVDNGYGYLCNPFFDIGIEPLEKDIEENYGLVCNEHHCDLYVPVTSYDSSVAKGIPLSQEALARRVELPEIDGIYRSAWQMSVDKERAEEVAAKRSRLFVVREAKMYDQLLMRHSTIPVPSSD